MVDAFTVDWSTYGLCYAFPPFNMVAKVVQKTIIERAELLLIAPAWTTQSWFPMVCNSLARHCEIQSVSFNNDKSLLSLPYDKTKIHGLWHRLNLSCFRISGKQ